MERAVEAVRDSPAVSALWIVRFVAAKKRVEPCGLALAIMKAQQVPGGGELILR